MNVRMVMRPVTDTLPDNVDHSHYAARVRCIPLELHSVQNLHFCCQPVHGTLERAERELLCL